MSPTHNSESKLIDGMLMTRFGREKGEALEKALQIITAEEATKRGFPWGRSAAAMAATLVLAVGLVYHYQFRTTGLTLVGPGIHATVFQADTVRPAADGTAMITGQILRAGDPVQLKYKGESTSINLSGNSELKIESHHSGKNLKLLRGSLVASVAPQKVPMRVETPGGSVEVIGTHFEVDAPAGATWLKVEEGTVRWRGLGKQTLLVKAGQCVVDSLGIAAGPHPLIANAPPSQLPFAWKWQPASTEGDGVWSLENGSLTQRKIALQRPGSIPDSLPGEPNCPVSVCLTETPTAASFRLECTLTIDGALPPSSDASPPRELAGLRLLFEDQFLEILTGRNPQSSPDPMSSYQAISRTSLDPALRYPSEILHGGLAPDFGKIACRVILQVQRGSEGGAVIRGKLWAVDAPEPVYWSLQAWVPKLGALKRTGGLTAHCSATFSDLKAYLIP